MSRHLRPFLAVDKVPEPFGFGSDNGSPASSTHLPKELLHCIVVASHPHDRVGGAEKLAVGAANLRPQTGGLLLDLHMECFMKRSYLWEGIVRREDLGGGGDGRGVESRHDGRRERSGRLRRRCSDVGCNAITRFAFACSSRGRRYVSVVCGRLRAALVV